MNPFKKNDASLSKKLKGALTDLTVDIFGYEKMVTKTITNRTNYISNRLQIPKDRLYIRIFQKDHIIRSFLYNQSKPVSAIPTQELTYFFMEEQLAQLDNVQNKVAFSIKQYLKEFAEANRIDEESVRIWIHLKDDKVQVRAFQNEEFIKQIPLNSLIKYFK
ncbi:MULTISPECIES: hypothetical protein [Flavobacteriaceae]|jgi:hypothetical protein|uniref:hypothetical protein n=1 Tax=Flavobacteriaceae TaxID=49546 RepID=UPI0015B8E514|nr:MULTISPECIES: hypothetical protein [Flavobacteriaceae]|tara:strand:- start:3278 stop:3763 length:486 start_codon:yes stop_codon:yes gene_type:complete